MVEEVILIKDKDSVLLKIAIAKILYDKNFDQPKISEILNISQPMVSNYIKSKEKIPKNINKLAEKITQKITQGNTTTFHTCVTYTNKPIEGKYYIAEKNEIITDENNNIVDNLTEAFLLLKGQEISGLIPEVKINIAMAKENAETSEDVAAFLNGLIIADDKITGFNGIRFGSSKHLSSILTNLGKKIDIKAIMNIAYLKDVENTNLKFGFLTKDFKLENDKKEYDILLHKGDFGIEPCSYILGKNAVDVVNKVIKIKEEIK